MATYRVNERALQQLVANSEFMEAEMLRRAKHAAEFAKSIAPVDPESPEPGRYRDSIKPTSGRDGGPEGNCAYGEVSTNAPAEHAHRSLSEFVEFGTEHNRAHHVMARTLDAL